MSQATEGCNNTSVTCAEEAYRSSCVCAHRCSTDGNKPDVSLEDAELIKAMFSLFHGSGQKGAQLPAEQTVQPASAAVRARLMSLLKRSLAAANAFPDNLQVHSHACALTLALWRALCKFNLT